MQHTASLVRPGGKLVVSIYNQQGRASSRWWRIKKAYSSAPRPVQIAILVPTFFRLWGRTFLYDALNGHPLSTWKAYNAHRGMSAMHDVVDWVGGYPFEVRTPDEVFNFYHSRGFRLEHLITRGAGHGCNEFMFVSEIKS